MAHRRRRHARDATLREALDTVDAQGLVCDFPPYHPGAARESHGVVVTLPTAAGGGGGGRPHGDAVALVAPHRASTAGGEPRTQPFINWSSLPPGLDPAYGDLEGYRAQRKREQVESLARVVCGVARPGDRIVEFGAGSGHLGLVLAHLLPLCHVVLVERKAFRAGLARRRIAQAGLSNVELCAADAQQYGREAIEALYGRAERADDGSDAQPAQAAGDAGLVDRAGGTAGASGGAGPASTLLPLDEDEEPLPAGARGKPFEIGVGLHTCGLLSDVLQNVCLRLGAAYVLCPCCYGQTAGFHARSQALADALAPAQFDAVASAADFTANAEDADFVHSPPFKMAKRCMAVVDTDRQRWARMAYGYETQGFSLMPLSSSPKNNIIVGAPPLAHVLPPTPLATPQQSPRPPTGLLVQKNNSSPRPAHAALLHHRHLHDQHHRRASGGSDRGVAGGGSDDAANEFAATPTRRHRNAWSVSRKILRRVLSSTTTASTAAAATAAATTPAAAAPATHGNHVLEEDMLQHKVSLLYHHFRRFFGCGGGDDGIGAGHYRGGRHIAQRDIHVVASPPTGHRLRVRFGLRRFPDSGGGLLYAEFHNGALSKPVSSCPAAAPAIQAAMPVLLAALGECSDVGAAAEAEAAAAADCRRELARQAARAYAGDGNPDADAAAGVAAVVEVVLGGSCRGSARSRHGVAAGLGALSAPARKVCRRLQQRRERLTAFGRAHAHLAEGLQAVHFLSTLAGDLLATLVYNRRLDGPPPSVTSHAAAAVGEGDGAGGSAGGPSETSSWYASALALSRRVGFDLVGRSRGQVVTVSGAGVRGAGDRGGDGGGAAGPREGNYVEECFELRPPQRWAQGAAETKDGQQRAPRQLRYRQVEGSFSNPNGVVNVRVLEWLSAVVGEFAGPAAEGGAAQDTAAGAAEEGAGQQEMSLLEIYCGCGNHTVALAPLFAHTTAIELNSHLASVCELNLSRNGMRKRVEVRQADSQRVCTQLLRATRASPREDRLRAQANAEAAAAMAAARTAASAAGTPVAEVSSGGGPSGGGGAAFFNALASPMPSPTAHRGSGAGGGAQHRPVKLWGRDYHCCLVDPPRAGLDPSTLAVVQRFPRVLYISCNPDSLYRDLRLLASTHAVRRFAVFDHFPGTRFVESGVFLERLGE